MLSFNRLLKVLAKAKTPTEGKTSFRLSIIMAKVNFGTIANDARGKINGTVYSKNKSGSYVRRKVTPANPNSPTQTAVRANFATLSQQWSGVLSESQRSQWITFANTYPRLDVFGASINISGLNMFISLNIVLMNLGVAPVLTPPVSNVVVPIGFDATGFNGIISATNINIHETAAGTATSWFYIFAARPLPPGRMAQRNDFRFLTASVGTGGPYPADYNIATDYVARFGSFPNGMRISALVATVDPTTGLTTVGAQLTGISS